MKCYTDAFLPGACKEGPMMTPGGMGTVRADVVVCKEASSPILGTFSNTPNDVR